MFSALHLMFYLFPPKQEEIIIVFHMHIISNPSDKLLIQWVFSQASLLRTPLLPHYKVSSEAKSNIFDPKISYLVWNPIHSGAASCVINE